VVCRDQYREIQKLVPPALKKYEAQMLPPIPGVDWRDGTDDIVPIRLKALLQELTDEEEERALQLAREQIRRQQRNEYEALEEAIPDLIRLERYERRAWSRHKRAIREFGLIKFLAEEKVTNVALEARDGTLRDQLRASEKECQIKSRALSEAERQLADKEAELTKLLGRRSLVAS
jgi:hypothetical protein